MDNLMIHYPTMLLVSLDIAVIEAVQGMIGSIGDLNLVAIASVDEACDAVMRDDVVLVLIHQDGEGDAVEVTRLLRVIAEAKRPVPTLVLSDRHRAEHALSLLRAGVADHLSRPLDLTR